MGFQGIGISSGPRSQTASDVTTMRVPEAAANAWHRRRNGFIFMGAPADVRTRVRDAKCISTPRARLSITGERSGQISACHMTLLAGEPPPGGRGRFRHVYFHSRR